MPATARARGYQGAETTRIARGRGTARPNARHAAVYLLISMAFIGLPCPKNAAGMMPLMARGYRLGPPDAPQWTVSASSPARCGGTRGGPSQPAPLAPVASVAPKE